MRRILLLSLTVLSFFNLYSIDYTSILIENAKNGDLASQKSLAKMYYEGTNIGKNLEESFYWIKKAAEQNDADALFTLYNFYKDGIGCERAERIDLLTQSAKLGNIQAIAESGRIYSLMPGQTETALKLLLYAYDKGETSTLPLIGGCYMDLSDFENGMKYFNKALNECTEDVDISNAYLGLSKIYSDGYGVEIDLKKSKDYVNRAIKISPRYESAYEQKGILCLREGDLEGAKKNWNIIMEISPYYAMNSHTELSLAMNQSVDYGIPISSKLNDKTYSLIIANENYKRVPNVPHALNDGSIFRKYLISTFGIPENNIEYLEDASLNDIKYALSNISQKCEAFKDQYTIIVYYAGHGVPDEKTSEAYLLPVDGFGTDPSSGLSLEMFYNTLSNLQAKSVIVLLDACFSGSKRDGGMLMATRGITIKPKMQVPDGKLIVISATADDQTAFPIEEQRHGLFTYTLLRKIQETSGDITWGELADYVSETVKNKSIDLVGKLQSPTVSVSNSLKDSWRSIRIK